MMTDKEYTLETMRSYGRNRAESVQTNAPTMTGTELNEQDGYIPDFVASCQKMNMLQRKAGQTDGFVCKSSAGRVVRLIQKYDSDVFTQEPEELAAQWAFVWSNNPAKAKPFVKMATSPYNTGDCCTFEVDGEDGSKVINVYRSTHDYNTYSPAEYPAWWELVE